MERITATDAARNFSDLVNRVKYRNESFVLLRNGEEVGRIVPPPSSQAFPTLRRLVEHLRSSRKPDDEFFADLDAIQGEQPVPPESPWDSSSTRAR